MTSSSRAVDYDALAATTSIKDMVEDELNRWTLASLKQDDKHYDYLSRLRLCSEDNAVNHGDYHPGSSEELGWLGHFAKKSAHLEEIEIYGSNIFKYCSTQSVDEFFEDLGTCSLIETFFLIFTDLTEIIHKLGPVMKNNDITHWYMDGCYLGAADANDLFNNFRYMKSLEVLYISYDEDGGQGYGYEEGHGLDDDDVMARCIPSLAACTNMRELTLKELSMSTSSCAELAVILSPMDALMELDLRDNLIDDGGVEVLVRGLAGCKHLHSLCLGCNRIGDHGLDVLIQGLPASVDTLDLARNEVTLARQLPLLRFNTIFLEGNSLSPSGPGIIAASLANPECRLEELDLFGTNIEADEGAATLAEGLRNNQRLTKISLTHSNITEMGWNALASVLCNNSSLNATHGSNHTLEFLNDCSDNVPKDIRTMLELNNGKDKSRVAANKILHAHRHLDMKPLFDRELDLLPHVVEWLDRFAESRLDHKLSLIYEFVRAMPQDVVDGVAGKMKGKKHRRDSSHGRHRGFLLRTKRG